MNRKHFISIFLVIILVLGFFLYFTHAKLITDTALKIPIRGTYLYIQSSNNSFFPTNNLQLLYKFDTNDDYAPSSIINSDNNIYEFRIEIPQDANKLSYHYNFEFLGIKFRYPNSNDLEMRIYDHITSITTNDINFIPLEHNKIKNENNVDFDIKIDKAYKTDTVVLNYKLNQWDFVKVNMKMKEENHYNLNIKLDQRPGQFEYYFEMHQESNIVEWPSERFYANDPEVDNMLNEVKSLSKRFDSSFTYLDTKGFGISHNGNVVRDPASTIKILVMIEVYQQLYQQKINLTDTVAKYGYSGTIEKALSDMMHFSDNSATGALVEKVGGRDVINATAKKYLGENTKIHFEHTPTFQGSRGEGSGENTMTTNEMALLMMKIYNAELINAKASKEMLDLMTNCYDWFEVKSNIKDINSIAMKTGFYPNRDFALIGFVKTNSNKEYAFAIQIHSNSGVPSKNILEILKIINKYVESGSI